MLALCVSVYDVFEPDNVASIWSLQWPGGITFNMAHGRLLDDARHSLTVTALANPEVTHLLFADADMAYPPDAAIRLAAHGKPIVGGLCFERRPPFSPTLFFGGGIPQLDYPRNALVRVASTGGAFILIERAVFEAVSQVEGAGLWWASTVRAGGLPLAGDESFLQRAKRLGYEVHVDTGVKTGHVGKVVVDEAFYDAWRRGAA